MSKIAVRGGKTLRGEIKAQGSKNAALPILAATVLNDEESIVLNCPNLSDVKCALRIIDILGGKTEYADHTAVVKADALRGTEIPEALMRSMRSSVLFLGPMISRLGYASMSYPGGCSIGIRPIDLHLKAFRELGVSVEETGGRIYCTAERITPSRVNLIFPSVGATENIMLLSAVSDGETVILNAAREPEIADLQSFLNAMGAKISGAGTETIRITGVEKLHKVQYNIMPDRIFAATCLCAVAACGGDVLLRNTDPEHISLLLSMLSQAGCNIDCGDTYIRIRCAERIRGMGKIMTSPYPGFPTDAQAIFMSASCIAEGTTVFVENIFEGRYKHVAELLKMGGDIIADGRIAAVTGCNYIQGASVEAGDLRGGAALVIAGLAAIGDTLVSGTEHIDRGYEEIEKTFAALGADIRRV